MSLGLVASLILVAPPAPAQLPQVTVRWEDPAQRDVFIVEGARYQCRVATLPARILSLIVDGKELLGAGGIEPAAVDVNGRPLVPAPAEVVPAWETWQGQNWHAASSARARMNVWSASPYYWDAHLLDIPLLATEDLTAYQGETNGPVLAEYDFSKDNAGWQGPHDCTLGRAPDGAMRLTLTGGDPYLVGPPLDVPGPVTVRVRMRQRSGAGTAFYWTGEGDTGQRGDKVVIFNAQPDGEWHDYAVTLPDERRITGLRLDPPGTSGEVDVAWIRVHPAQAGKALPKPVRGELVLHAQADRLGIELGTEPVAGAPEVKRAELRWDAALAPAGAASVVERDGARLGVLAGTGRSAWWILRPLDAGQAPEAAFAPDLHPLPPDAVTSPDGDWLGYDPASGLYRVAQHGDLRGYGFEAAYRNPSRRLDLPLEVRGDGTPRTLLVKASTGVGNLEGAVLADRWGFPLPASAFVCKNFAGEREEPDDTAFGDVYFPLELQAGQTRAVRLFSLTQNWGDHPLKQVSSIRFFLIYWHLSVGASETTCLTHNWMGTKGADFRIPDFRPLSGPFWRDQPQHDCQHWPGYLQCNDDRIKLMYERTVFDAVSPNLARLTMHYHTTDDSARARVEILEMPQRDELRTFIKLRYDWVAPCAIEGDARRSFRWFNLSHFRGRPELVLWTGPDGKTLTRAVPPKDGLVLLGEPLAAEAPFIASHGPGDKYGVLALVRRFAARLGGQDVPAPVFSAAFDKRDESTWLTVPQETLALQPGDWLEAELMLMPHGEPAPAALKPERERQRYGLAPVKVTCQVGERLEDLPPHVRAVDEVAQFTVAGGHGDLAVVADGFREPGVPLLWDGAIWQDQQVHGGDGYQVDPDGAGGYRFTFVAPHRDEQRHDMLVTRVSAPAGVARLADRNGRLVVEAAGPGGIRLKAPALFGPGRNRVTAGAPVVEFEGDAARAEQRPLSCEVAEGTVDCTVESWSAAGCVVRLSGAAALTLGDLRRGGSYLVTVDDQAADRVAPDGTLRIELARGGRLEVAAR
ncbi:MAG: hypothetical protein HYU66_11510 [Armatimonadetes bacterium]|nr:hypothetical protein [Armatimonadota bacterium]